MRDAYFCAWHYGILRLSITAVRGQPRPTRHLDHHLRGIGIGFPRQLIGGCGSTSGEVVDLAGRPKAGKIGKLIGLLTVCLVGGGYG